MMLTRKQHQLLMILKAAEAEERPCPSFHEIKDAMGLSSKSGVHRLIDALEERGFIERLRNRARAIRVLPDPHLSPRTTIPSDFETDELILELAARGYGIVPPEFMRARAA